jgi:hypothetical protein
MVYIHNGMEYRSKKFPMLEHIFNKLTENGTKGIGQDHTFTLKDISEGYRACGIPEPASISNTILDLTRKFGDITARLPPSIIAYGYDMRKKTGVDPKTGASFAGEFVYVGLGNTLLSWHLWTEEPDQIVVVSNKVPPKIAKYLSNDEGALFSAIDYCDVLSLAIYGYDHPGTILRIQNPMKWQPNEIDGLYFSDFEGVDTLYPTEAKALSTRDDINLEQMLGAYRTITQRLPNVKVVPLGIKMIQNGMRIGLFNGADDQLEITRHIKITFDPPISSWRAGPRRRGDSPAMMDTLFPDM